MSGPWLSETGGSAFALVPNNVTPGTKMNALESESNALPSFESFKHALRWRDQSGAGVGDPIVQAGYATFTASWTEAATYSNGSAVITGITHTIRIQPGMQFTATGFTGTQTVVSVDSATQITASTTATGAGGATTLTFTNQDTIDPVFRFGYNGSPGSGEVVARQGYALFNIEGHYHNDSNDLPMMEYYLAFGIDGGGGEARPIQVNYDKLNRKTMGVYLNPGRDYGLTIAFGNHSGDYAGTPAVYTLEENKFTMLRAPHQTAEDTYFIIDSHPSRNSYFQQSANGDSTTYPSYRREIAPAGGSSQHRTASTQMRSNGSTSFKTGKLVLRADDTAGYDSVMFSLGTSGSNIALFHISHVNMPTNVPTVTIVPKASQSRAIFEIDGLNNDNSTAEARKWQLYPKGYIAVRESGNTTIDRVPGTGAQAVTSPTYGNKPGTTSPIGDPTAWFPMLTSAGALCWVPGWAD